MCFSFCCVAGFFNVLSELTKTGDVSPEQFMSKPHTTPILCIFGQKIHSSPSCNCNVHLYNLLYQSMEWLTPKLEPRLCVSASRKVWAHEEDGRLLRCRSRGHKYRTDSCHSHANHRAQIHPLLCKGNITSQRAVHAAITMKCLFPVRRNPIKKLIISDAGFERG